MTLTIKASDVQSSEFLDTADKVADALIVTPSYLMRSPSQHFAIENEYSKSEAIYELTYSIAGTVLKIDTFAGYVKGNIGLHFIKTKAPILIDIASLTDGDYKVLFFVNYHEYLVGQEGQLSDLEIRVAPQSDSTTEGTKILDFNLNAGVIENVLAVKLHQKDIHDRYILTTANTTADMGDILLVDATNTTSTIGDVDVIEITLPNPAPNTHVRYVDIKGLFESDTKGVRLKTANADDTVMGYDTNDDATAIVTDTKNASRTLIAIENGNNFDWRFI